jgi:dihydrofolate reductase
VRKVIFGGATSLDNFLTGPNEAIDWLLWCDEVQTSMADLWKAIDTIVMGRKTYEFALRQNPGGGGGQPGVTTYVFSRTLPEGPARDGAIIARDAVAGVRKLKGEPGKDIILMGGGELAQSLFEADLVDEIGFNVHPILLGGGVPAFHPLSRRIPLELKECRPLKNGCVLVTYRVKH